MSSFPFQVVAFDLDGTLVDSAPDLSASLNHALVRLGRTPVSEESVRHMVGHGARALLEKGLAATGEMTPALVDEGFPIFLDYYAAHIADRTRPFPGLEAALDTLSARGVKLAVCTNKLESLSRLLIDALGWQGRFAALVGGDTLPVRKPDPAPVLEAIARAGGGRAAFVGDSISDTDAARAGGVPCVAVTFGFSDRPVEQLGASVLIDHFDALVPALEGLGQKSSPIGGGGAGVARDGGVSPYRIAGYPSTTLRAVPLPPRGRIEGQEPSSALLHIPIPCPVSSKLLSPERMRGQPPCTPSRTALPSGKPEWVTVSRLSSREGSMR
jgi:phosphoglycolate phosphatase